MWSPYTKLSLLAAAALPGVVSAEILPNYVQAIEGALLGSIRTSWEQGTAMHAITQLHYPQYSVFGNSPFSGGNELPVKLLTFAVSAVTRQSADGRLSQVVNGDADGAALDGSSAGVGVWIGANTDPKRSDYFLTAAKKQLNYLLNTVPRTKSGAISMRHNSRQYWADGVFMGPPFLAYAGVMNKDQSLVQLGYDQVRLYRDVLLNKTGPTGPAWMHIYNDDSNKYQDSGIWATGNGWAALGAVNVLATILKSPYKDEMAAQTANLTQWTLEAVNATLSAINSEGLVPDYIAGKSAIFGDAAASGALVAAYYRLAQMAPKVAGPLVTPVLHKAASTIRKTIFDSVDELGLIGPVVDPLSWEALGTVSTEGQAFALMMYSAWRDLHFI